MATEFHAEKHAAVSAARSRSATYHYKDLRCATLSRRCVKTSGTADTYTLIYHADKVKYAVCGPHCLPRWCVCRGEISITYAENNSVTSSPSVRQDWIHPDNLNIKLYGGEWGWLKLKGMFFNIKQIRAPVETWHQRNISLNALIWIRTVEQMRSRLWRVLKVEECRQGLRRHAPSWFRAMVHWQQGNTMTV